MRTAENSFAGAEFQSKGLGMRPLLRKNGAYPVVSERAELITNSIAGSFNTQSVCFGDTHCRNIVVTVLFIRSVDPSVSG